MKVTSAFMLALLLSSCADKERFALVCSLSGPSVGKAAEYRFPVNEPAKKMGWSSVAGFQPVRIQEWTDKAIRGQFDIGETSVDLELDRPSKAMKLVRRNPLSSDQVNEGSCTTGGITQQEQQQLAGSMS